MSANRILLRGEANPLRLFLCSDLKHMVESFRADTATPAFRKRFLAWLFRAKIGIRMRLFQQKRASDFTP
jgi:hypothetical protein